MAQRFHRFASPEEIQKLVAATVDIPITEGVFCGGKVRTIAKEALPAGCIGVLTHPSDPGKCALIIETTDRPAE